MIQSPKSLYSYQNDILAALTATGITQTSPGGKARAFTDIVANEMSVLDTNTYLNIGQSLIAYATGDSLDYLGSVFGVTRIPRSDSSSSSTDNNFTFYVSSGTFGTINNGNGFVVPQGTRIFTDDPNGPVYVTSFDVTIDPTLSSQSFSAVSLDTGSAGNAASGVFTRTNFANYVGSTYGGLQVTNNFGIIGGRDAEGDDSFRYRINLKLQSNNGAAEVDLRLAILNVPGIQDVVFERLAGTFNAYLYAISPSVSPILLSTVQSVLNDKVSYPIVGTVITPDLVGISLETTITFTAGTSQSNQSSIIANATVAASNYINNLAIGETLVINTLAGVISSADSQILDIGQPDNPIEAIYIWRSRSDGTRYSRSLIANLVPQIGERIVVEAIDSPINLVVGT